MEKQRILLAHRSAIVLVNLTEELRRRRVRAEIDAVQSGALLIQRQCFLPAGVVLVDLAFDGAERILQCLWSDPSHPRVYACSEARSPEALPPWAQKSADGCGLGGTPVGAICDALLLLLESGATPEIRAANRARRHEDLQRLLFLAGVSPHLKGGRYLREALEMAADDPRLLDNMDGRLYPALALRLGDSPANVERSMRYAVCRLWERMDPGERQRLLPRCPVPPGNKRFLAALDRRLRESAAFAAAAAPHITSMSAHQSAPFSSYSEMSSVFAP